MDDYGWNKKKVESILNGQGRPSDSPEQEQVGNWSKLVLKMLLDFHNIDLYQCEKFHNCSKHSAKERPTPTTLPKWTKVIRALFYWTTFRMILAIVCQYIYDNHKLQRNRILNSLTLLTNNKTLNDFRDSETSGNNRDQNPKLVNLTVALSASNVSLIEARQWVKFLGSPYLEFEFMPECIYIVVIFLGLTLYWQVYLFHCHFLPANLSLVRLLLNRERERKNIYQMTVDEADRFIESSYNFALVQGQRIRGAYDHRRRNCRSPSILDRRDRYPVGFGLERHRKTVDIIRKLFHEGKLEPINRDAKYLDKLSRYFTLSSLLFLCSFAIFTTVMLILIPNLRRNDWLEFTGFMDYLFNVEILTLSYLTCLWATTGVNIISLHSIDFISIVIKLNRQVKSLLNDSVGLVAKLDVYPNLERAGQTSVDNLQLDSRLILVYLQYKFLLRQLNVVRPLFSFYLTSAIQMMLLVPVLLFVHYPYIQMGRRMLLIPCAVYLIGGDLCSLPMCYMHGRCMNLYRLLFGLFAHIIKVKMEETDDLRNKAYPLAPCAGPNTDLSSYGHTIWLLHKELSLPERLIGQFEFKLHGMPNTYPYILKYHLYLGLLILFSLWLGSKIDVTTNEATFLSSSFKLI